MATTVQRCPACNEPLCYTDSHDPWDVSIGIMEDAMDAHLPDCGLSNTPEVKAAAQAVADTLRSAAQATATPPAPDTD